MSVNRAILIGNLGTDPEVRFLPNQTQVTQFSLATSRSWKDKEGAKQTETEWHRVVIFGKLAEIAGKYLTKGSQAYISGRIQTRKWEGKDGQTHYTTEIIGEELTMLGGKPGNGDGDKPEARVKPTQSKPVKSSAEEDYDDSIPF